MTQWLHEKREGREGRRHWDRRSAAADLLMTSQKKDHLLLDRG